VYLEDGIAHIDMMIAGGQGAR
jgi:hypothetical protein